MLANITDSAANFYKTCIQITDIYQISISQTVNIYFLQQTRWNIYDIKQNFKSEN